MEYMVYDIWCIVHDIWEFPKIGSLVWTLNSRTRVIRTPTSRTPKLEKQPFASEACDCGFLPSRRFRKAGPTAGSELAGPKRDILQKSKLLSSMCLQSFQALSTIYRKTVCPNV